MRAHLTALAAAAVACLLGGSDARAAFVQWSYNWSRVPADVISADAFGTSKLSLTDEPLGRATNSSDVVATNIRTFSDAPRANPNSFQDAAYSLTLRLTDDASGETASLKFDGTFSGTLSASSADITTAFLGETTQMVTLGGHEYVVTMGDYSPPGPPGINNAGSIGATVEVRPAVEEPPPPPPSEAPEPATVLLAGTGLSLLGGAWLRRRRGGRPVDAQV